MDQPLWRGSIVPTPPTLYQGACYDLTMTKLSFYGGAGTVTGSKYLLEHNGFKMLVDCGFFQGPRSIRERNWQPPPFKPSDVDLVLLTHAHLDHTGYLPVVEKGIVDAISNLRQRRQLDYVGAMMWRDYQRSTEYFSRWIELKERLGPQA